MRIKVKTSIPVEYHVDVNKNSTPQGRRASAQHMMQQVESWFGKADYEDTY